MLKGMVTPRKAHPTLRFVDEYCELYADLFPEVQRFEAFKYLHIGMISDLKRKSLPAIAKAVGLDNEQGLHNLLTESSWSVAAASLESAAGVDSETIIDPVN